MALLDYFCQAPTTSVRDCGAGVGMHLPVCVDFELGPVFSKFEAKGNTGREPARHSMPRIQTSCDALAPCDANRLTD